MQLCGRPPTKQARQNGDAHAFPGRTRTRLPTKCPCFFVKLALPGPDRRRRQFLCDNGIHQCTLHSPIRHVGPSCRRADALRAIQ